MHSVIATTVLVSILIRMIVKVEKLCTARVAILAVADDLALAEIVGAGTGDREEHCAHQRRAVVVALDARIAHNAGSEGCGGGIERGQCCHAEHCARNGH